MKRRRDRYRTRTETRGQSLGCGLGHSQEAGIIPGMRLSTGTTPTKPRTQGQDLGRSSAGRDQTRNGAWEPGEGLGWSSASRAAGTGADTLTWNVPAPFQWLLHQAGSRARSSGVSHKHPSDALRGVTEFQNIPCWVGLWFLFFQCWNPGIFSNLAVSEAQRVI